jgi:flagellar biosynthesis/type III secretory pathway chaperone
MSLNQQILQSLRKLEVLLEREFEALKSQDLDTFDQIQQQKAPILHFFSDSAFIATGSAPAAVASQATGPASIQESTPVPDNAGALTPELTDLARHCQTLHRRNEIFINRKLEAVRGALRALQSPAHGRDVEVYDRLGRLGSGPSLKRPLER